MKISTLLFSLSLFFFSSKIFSQEIKEDIFGNFEYCSKNNNYCAYLKKDIFNNFIFTDKYNNKITFEEKYIENNLPELEKDKDYTKHFFRDQIAQYRSAENYIKTYSIDIFGKEIITDNKNNRVESGNDIFGNYQYEENYQTIKTNVSQDNLGFWSFKRNNQLASLKKNIHQRWEYNDSFGNKMEFSEKSWDKFKKNHGSEKNIFLNIIENIFN